MEEETISQSFERLLKASLRDHDLLPPDDTYPADTPSECLSLLPIPAAITLLDRVILQAQPFAAVVKDNLVTRLRAYALRLPPVLLDQLHLDLLIIAASRLRGISAARSFDPCWALVRRMLARPQLDLGRRASFDPWLEATLAEIRALDAMGTPLPRPVRANLVGALSEAPLMLALQAYSVLCTTRLRMLLNPLHQHLQSLLHDFVSGVAQPQAQYTPPTLTGRLTALTQTFLPLLGAWPLRDTFLSCVEDLCNRIPLSALYALTPSIEVLPQTDLARNLERLFQRRVDAFADSLFHTPLMDPDEELLMTLLTYIAQVPSDSFNDVAKRLVTAYASNLDALGSLGLLHWSRNTFHAHLHQALLHTHITHHGHPDIESYHFTYCGRALAAKRQRYFCSYAEAEAEAPAPLIQESVRAAVAAAERLPEPPTSEPPTPRHSSSTGPPSLRELPTDSDSDNSPPPSPRDPTPSPTPSRSSLGSPPGCPQPSNTDDSGNAYRFRWVPHPLGFILQPAPDSSAPPRGPAQ